MLNVLDLFSGTGELGRAFGEALAHHGIRSRVAAYCERERYPQGILLSRMLRGEIDRAPISTDVCKLTGEGLLQATGLESIDAFIGGFPCQDISVAGLGGGLDGERSGLFFEIIRLAGELRPALIGLENVPAILVRGGGRCVGALAALGYSVRWGIAGADDFGGTHKRERFWCLAYAPGCGDYLIPRDEVDRQKRKPEQAGMGGWIVPREPLAAPERDESINGHDQPSLGVGLANAESEFSKRSRGTRSGRPRPSDFGRVGQADADGSGPQERSGEQGDPRPKQPAIERGGDEVEHSHGGRCGQPDARVRQLQEPSAGRLPVRPPVPGSPAWEQILREHPEVEPALCGVASRVAFRNDRIRACGNGVDYICATEAFKILLGAIK